MAKIHLVTGSTLGAAEYVAEYIAEKLTDAGHQTQLHNPTSVAALELEPEEIVLVVTSTHGAGEIPDNLQPFAHELAEQKPDLSHCRFAIVALGDSNYDTFCAGGRLVDQLLEQNGAQKIGDRLEIDVTQHDLPEDAADIWFAEWSQNLS